MAIPRKPERKGIRRDYTCDTCDGEEIVQTTNLMLIKASKGVVGKLSRGLEVRVLSGAPIDENQIIVRCLFF
ncbi:MAG: hypothetical protein DRI70_09540 [Bacteroidetes bacterium]|nr:MAG: hypothetical protein DRI70_09540 [Bacteroidota bacterium]